MRATDFRRERGSRIRRSLIELHALARNVTIERDLTTALRDAWRRFIVEFSLHLDSEEDLLLPLVERADAWGPQRAEAMRVEHQAQRMLLREMFAHSVVLAERTCSRKK
jgi:hypothetical protein